MNDYEKYMAINILFDAYAKYQGKCMDYLHNIQLKINECNNFNYKDPKMMEDLTQKKANVESELETISEDLKTLASERINTLSDIQTSIGGLTLNFKSLNY